MAKTMFSNFALPSLAASLVQTCIANQVDLYRYFNSVIERMPYARSQTDFEALPPWVLKQEFEDEAATVKLAA
jgi:hypothetical protein